MQFNVHKWTFKVVILCVLLAITGVRVNSTLQYRALHKYDEYIRRELTVDDLHEFSAELLKLNQSQLKINFSDYSFNLLIDNNDKIKSFVLVAMTDHQDYKIRYEYNKKISVEKVDMKTVEAYDQYSFLEMENFVDLLYRQLNLSALLEDKKRIRIVRMVKLTKDFVYNEEGNFDKVSYSKGPDDKNLNKINDGEVINKDGVKVNVNINTEGFERENRVASVYLYY